jgi:choline dehydrogenase-like flavoprotein
VPTDARAASAQSEIDADLCVIGSGPAGMSVASRFVGGRADVVLLESGGDEPDARAQALNAGAVEGDAYSGLEVTRHRQVGGTAHLWNTVVDRERGAKFTPLDAVDLERDETSLGGWPLGYADLEPYYRQAHAFCALGPFAYDAAGGSGPAAPGPTPLPLHRHLTNRVYRFGRLRAFATTWPAALRAAPNIRLLRHVTACRVRTDGCGRRVTALDAIADDGRTLTVRARQIVLAAGAIENARLLLLSADALGLGPAKEWAGRCFVEHPRDFALSLRPRSPELLSRAAFYDFHRADEGAALAGRIGFAASALREARVPNASVTLLPRLRPVGPLRQRVRDAMRRHFGWNPTPTDFGWSRVHDPHRRYDGFRLVVNLEQQPHIDNRVVLGHRRDALGLPEPVLYWRWRPEEQAGLERLRRALGRWLTESGLGEVECRNDVAVDPNAHHHAGTTRMHSGPRGGVVDADCRVHGVDNLHVAGASVFPTAGWANPTLTIVALGLRLGDHLRAAL